MLARHLELVDDLLIDLFVHRHDSDSPDVLILEAPPRHGKALEVSTPIPTPTGWCEIGELRVGDAVYDETGNTCRVVAVSEVWHNRPLVRVASNSVDPIYADTNHEWQVRLDRKLGAITVRTSGYLANRTSTRRPLIACAGSLEGTELGLIDPWYLGYWLGDGNTRHGAICVGDQDREWVRHKLVARGHRVSDYSDGKTLGVLGANPKLRSLGVLGAKHIPPAYLRASVRERLELLQGLIDSDGHVAPDGQIEYCSTNERLANDVAELVRSLGCKCSIILGRATLNGRDCGPKYRVMFYMLNAASLPRKAERTRNGTKSTGHYPVFASTNMVGDTVCIEVDSPSHLFLAGRSMVPTHNSELISKYLPTWYIGRNPDDRVILASYADSLAKNFGRRCRDMLSERASWFGLRGVREDVSAASEWDVIGHEGGMLTAGVGGPITGRGANLLIIDDPVKNSEQAVSETVRENQWEWFQSTAWTRLEPGGKAVVMMTRWHEDDLAGKLLKLGRSELGVTVREVKLPAICTDPDTDPLGRAAGEPLWPERWPVDALQKRRKLLDVYWWNALYQQSPGQYGKSDWPNEYFGPGIWATHDEWPDSFEASAIAVDPAIGSAKGDFSAIVFAGLARGVLWIDSIIERMPVPAMCQSIIDFYLLHDADAVGIEANVFQSTLAPEVARVQRLTKGCPPLPLHGIHNTTQKRLRIGARVGPLLAMSGLRFLRNSGNTRLVNQLKAFPLGDHDDGPDALEMVIRLLNHVVRGQRDE